MSCPYCMNRVTDYYCTGDKEYILKANYDYYCAGDNYKNCPTYKKYNYVDSEDWGRAVCPHSSLRHGRHFCELSYKWIYYDTFSQYCGNYSYDKCPTYNCEDGGGGCYLTTACAVACGLGDDCEELQTLRQFRDGWLKAQPFGPAEIREYYETAPGLIVRMKESREYAEMMQGIYDSLIRPCVAHIRRGEMEDAYALYKRTVAELKEKFPHR